MASTGSGERVGEKMIDFGKAVLISAAFEESPEDLNPWMYMIFIGFLGFNSLNKRKTEEGWQSLSQVPMYLTYRCAVLKGKLTSITGEDGRDQEIHY
jgi:hypothetical protein